METTQTHATLEDCRRLIRDVPDFQKKGIVFKDITPLLKDGPCFRSVVDRIADALTRERQAPEIVACPEARGFIFGSAIAYRLKIGLVPIRKPRKLPYKTCSVEYDLEYGKDSVEMHVDAIGKGQRVVLVDDLLATGGTIAACAKLIEGRGARVEACAFLVELDFLKGREKLAKYPIFSLLHF